MDLAVQVGDGNWYCCVYRHFDYLYMQVLSESVANALAFMVIYRPKKPKGVSGFLRLLEREKLG